MSRFRALKSTIRPWLRKADWTWEHPLPPQATDVLSREADTKTSDPNSNLNLLSLVNPLFSCLPEGGRVTERAAYALGNVINQLYTQKPEEARNIIRRFIWQMNVESGNIGWGIPEAFGSTLAQNHDLAREYHKGLFHYIYDKKNDSSYCDYAPLRRSCYMAIGDVIRAWPEYSALAASLLQQSLENDTDMACRQLAEKLLDELNWPTKS